MTDGMARIDADEAVHLLERMGIAQWPATLHPRYVLADATRNAILQPAFLCFRRGDAVWLHGLHLTEIPGTPWKDASSPYGYGGPVANSDDATFRKDVWRAYAQWMRDNAVVVEYVRFHPLVGNDALYCGNVVPNRTVVCIDLRTDDLAAGYEARVRGTIRKAERAGLVYEEVPLASAHHAFAQFHRAAMHAMGAGEFYVFADHYFASMAHVPGAVVGAVRAAADDQEWLAAALFLDGRGVREYHLAGATEAGRKLGASSFLLHRAALAARSRGVSELYLGGGTDAKPDNPLFFFKSGFSPRHLSYRTGWSVFDESAYAQLKERFAEQWRAHPHWPIFHRNV